MHATAANTPISTSRPTGGYSLASPHEFVKAWQESYYVREVARKVGSTKGACSRRATRYREMGVPMKFKEPIETYEPTDWDELNTSQQMEK